VARLTNRPVEADLCTVLAISITSLRLPRCTQSERQRTTCLSFELEGGKGFSVFQRCLAAGTAVGGHPSNGSICCEQRLLAAASPLLAVSLRRLLSQ
jgi:hypothetical protein